MSSIPRTAPRPAGSAHPAPRPAGSEDRIGQIYDHTLMVRMLRYLRPSLGLVVLATVLLIVFSLASLAGPLITQIGIDRYIAKGNFAGLLRICALWLGLIVVTGVLQYAQFILMSLLGQQAMLRLRQDIYRHLQRLPIAFFDRNPVGRLVTRATNDVEVLNDMFTQGVVAIFGDVFTLVGIIVILCAMNVRLALVTLASLPLVFLISIQFRARVRRAFRDIRTAVARINTYLQEALGGIAVIKALRREERNEHEFDELNVAHRDAFLESVRAFALYFPLVELIQSVSVALILWYGGGRVVRDHLSFGALVAFIQYAGRFFRPIRDLSDKFNILQDAMAASERIFTLLDEPVEADAAVVDGPAAAGGGADGDTERAAAGGPGRQDTLPTRESRRPAPLPTGEIRFEDVHFTYDGRTPVLRGITFTVPSGTTTAIVGATGGGKTTIATLLQRFYDPTAGRISIGGVDIREIPRQRLRAAMAVVQQDVFLFSGTLAENIRLWDAGITDEQLAAAVHTSHVDHLIHRLPDGLASPVAERGSSFSTGERQLIAFARALVFGPEILILDEATASIDSETELLIQDALQTLLAGRTSIVIAHRLSTVRGADQILVVQHGRIVERGTHDELLARGGVYARLYCLQFQGQEGECAEPRPPS
jgi:ATP-binding cassette subfamily B multidrug efflux pump